ncbi:hypothetical protein FOA52_002905 [Chlamydomonas sp. UWO 241]|nr:hypothetical protein FOA52_002905 [Chlamydomonas sp. UWO 241]
MLASYLAALLILGCVCAGQQGVVGQDGDGSRGLLRGVSSGVDTELPGHGLAGGRHLSAKTASDAAAPVKSPKSTGQGSPPSPSSGSASGRAGASASASRNSSTRAGRTGGSKGTLCSGTTFHLREDQPISSFSALTKMFAKYTSIPTFIDARRNVVAVELRTPRPCGAFTSNATFHLRVGLRDIKQFKDVFQLQALGGVRALLKGKEPKRILDIGARTGLTTVYLATQFLQAQVVATEPSLPEFSLLRLNTAHLPNVHVEFGVAWDAPATIKLMPQDAASLLLTTAARGSAERARPALWHRFVVDVMEVAGGGRLGDLVPGFTVNDLLTKHGWPDVDVVVGDLEGTEKVVLGEGDGQGKGAAGLAWLRRVRVVALRLAPGQSHLGASRLLGSAFVQCGHAAHHQFWCRV